MLYFQEIYLLYIIGKTAFDLLIKNDVDIE